LARIQELNAAVSVKQLEIENVRQKTVALETRLERSRAVIEAQQKQLEAQTAIPVEKTESQFTEEDNAVGLRSQVGESVICLNVWLKGWGKKDS